MWNTASLVSPPDRPDGVTLNSPCSVNGGVHRTDPAALPTLIPAAVVDVTRVHVAPPSALKFTSNPWVAGYVLVQRTGNPSTPRLAHCHVSPPFGLVICTVPPPVGADDSTSVKSA